MKASDAREMSPGEIKQKVEDLKEEYFNLRFQHEVGQLENQSRLKQARRDIARMKTVLRETEDQKKNDEE